MRHLIKTTILAAGIGALALAPTAPQVEARPRRGAVAAGVAAGVVGGVIVGSLAARQYGYGYAAPAYGPGDAYYREPHAYYEEPGHYGPQRQFGYVRRGTTGLRSGVTRVSPHSDY
jgi:hypothetical protein